jgi:2,4-dienoyl-CoA reductase-like NADH-dependent reductase (Old Yellow Enzyme family)
MNTYRRMASLKTAADFREYQRQLGIQIPFEEELLSGPTSPLAQPLRLDDFTIGNRFAILPMEGWDGTTDGKPTELTTRRWQRFGRSGAKLIWGGEAVAVRHDGRANPRQLLLNAANLPALSALRAALVREHQQHFGTTADLLIGLQLTHSGRFSRPNDHHRLEPVIAFHHPMLAEKFGLAPDYPVLSDEAIERLIEEFIHAAKLAQQAGFAFVDLKTCHSYLGQEILSAVDRPGKFGGSFENRTRFLHEIIRGIRAECPGLRIGVRFNAMDWLPFRKGKDGVGEPYPLSDYFPEGKYPYAFGGDGSGLGHDLTEPLQLLDLLASLGVRLVCITLGSPYYNPHLLRPALFPPTDGYMPPEDPLVGVARHLAITAELKRLRPQMVMVGSGYTYLQEWLPHVAQAVLRQGQADFVGLGRMVLTYPELPADLLAGHPLRRKQICRTFSDCTSGPRLGLISGCFPLDPFYKEREEALQLEQLKRGNK